MSYIGKWRFHSIGVINEAGNLTYMNAEEYINSPMPKEEYESYLAELESGGEKELRPGMICMRCSDWEERNGELWFDSGIEGEAFGEDTDTWAKAIDENGLFTFMTMRYEKE